MDDDVSWNSIAAAPEKEEEEDEGDMPVVSGGSRQTRSHTFSLFLRSSRVSPWAELARAPLLALCCGGLCWIAAGSSGRRSELPADQSSPFFTYPCVPRASTVLLLQNSCWSKALGLGLLGYSVCGGVRSGDCAFL